MNGSEDEANQLLTVAEVAKFLNVTVRTVMNYKSRKLIRYYQTGRIVRFRLSDLQEHIDSNSINPNSQNNG